MESALTELLTEQKTSFTLPLSELIHPITAATTPVRLSHLAQACILNSIHQLSASLSQRNLQCPCGSLLGGCMSHASCVLEVGECSAGEREEMVRARNTAKGGVFTGRRRNLSTRVMTTK